MVMQPFSATLGPSERERAWQELTEREFDVLVIGGGVTGAGTALDAATRGLRTGLVEARDFASGTSSRSSKLFHGGLRYLEQLNFSLVAEALKERELMLTRIAPHLVHPVPFLYPLSHRGWERPYVATGLAMYDQMGGARSVPRQKHLTRGGALKLFPGLKSDALVGAVRYYDAQADDARHTMTVARTAAHYGAVVRSSTEVVEIIKEADRVTGVVVRDVETDERATVRARVVVNATGVWTDDVQKMAGGRGRFRVRASKGVHILVPRDRIAGEVGLILRTEKSVLFVIPWYQHWIIGTTDTDWTHDLAHPAATAHDIDYILEHVNTVLAVPVTRDDIVGVYAGLRPLLAGESEDTSQLSREHAVARPAPGLIAIAGGKYTTYRVMAQDAVDAAAQDLGPLKDSVTEHVPLIGADGYAAMVNLEHELAAETGLPEWRIEHLLGRYGSQLHEVLALAEEDPSMLEPVKSAEQYLRAELKYAVTHEGALHLADVLARRTRMSIETRHRGVDAAEETAAIMAGVLGWDDAKVREEIDAYVERVRAERASQELDTDEASDAARQEAPETRAGLRDVIATK
ncbi:glycerol-3-phosphate dehydrogenase/oxidase [Luteipulveratus sp. YIM 133132]|uniref:Glycerol-3-phosphate dehydrogenase n=1 Tax=Luteipulveratus flavus TaxID=3031728 RepID=A0ABT6C2R8_9MICO|nr:MULTISPECIES: glycerol-3-phosphate dehydrogenase/oxidase [unclassified Luteipulveratus]MDE9364683.1 glycerol-3-phosphate dehydrogenase/oxidase [Luteipulveratus sp. YIM 133132]MDF8262843.1 glycerol-3-phosphate dehydrogenase/oxidase [Luteipulveratus sp. YIM 133296]